MIFIYWFIGCAEHKIGFYKDEKKLLTQNNYLIKWYLYNKFSDNPIVTIYGFWVHKVDANHKWLTNDETTQTYEYTFHSKY